MELEWNVILARTRRAKIAITCPCVETAAEHFGKSKSLGRWCECEFGTTGVLNVEFRFGNGLASFRWASFSESVVRILHKKYTISWNIYLAFISTSSSARWRKRYCHGSEMDLRHVAWECWRNQDKSWFWCTWGVHWYCMYAMLYSRYRSPYHEALPWVYILDPRTARRHWRNTERHPPEFPMLFCTGIYSRKSSEMNRRIEKDPGGRYRGHPKGLEFKFVAKPILVDKKVRFRHQPLPSP